MLRQRQAQKQGSSNERHIETACGLYACPEDSDQAYLYDAADQMRADTTPEFLRSQKGTKKREMVNGKKITKSRPYRVHLPLQLDSEYQTLPNPETDPAFHELILRKLHRIGRGSLPLTVQFNTIRPSRAGTAIYLHPLFRRAFPKASPDLEMPSDPLAAYLCRLFPGSKIKPCRDLADDDYRRVSKLRVVRIDIYAHFATADLWKMWPEGSIRDFLLQLAYQEKPLIDQGRRLKFEYTWKRADGREIRSRWLRVPAVVHLGGVPFALELGLVDTCGMAGGEGVSLAGFHSAAGLAMQYKDNYAKAEKPYMLVHMAASCDPEGIAAGAYAGVEKALPGALDKALIACEAYPGKNRFLDYAAGDVASLYPAVEAFAGQFYQLYSSLGLVAYYRPPRFTIGSTIHDLLQAAVFAKFDQAGAQVLKKKELKQLLIDGFEPSRARGLAEQATWAAANARVFGGRVVNVAPTVVSLKDAAVCDMDLGGAYPRSMDCQILPVGRPVIDQKFTSRSRRNQHPVLETYLRQHEKEFVPGCWQIIFSVQDAQGQLLRLPSEQDFFASWTVPSVFEEELPDEEEPGIWLERSDLVKIRTRYIKNAILTVDGLDILRYAFSPELRSFILKNGRVKSAMWYPASERIRNDSPLGFLQGVEAHRASKASNTSKVKVRRGGTKITTTEREYHGWIGLQISDLLTDQLTVERKRWKPFTNEYTLLRERNITSVEGLAALNEQEREHFEDLATKHEGGHPDGSVGLIEASINTSKHAKDELAKLAANTIYGDLVSRFFVLSNPCVGNNITARVRAIIWCFEKACRGLCTITDGGPFDLNQVNAPRQGRRLTEGNTVRGHEVSARDLRTNHHIDLKPLGYSEPDPVLKWEWEGEKLALTRASGRHLLEVSAAKPMIDRMTLNHVRNCFDHRIRVINPQTSTFDFEAKGVVRDIALHGTANYFMRGGAHPGYKDGKDWIIKFRSYPAHTHDRIHPFFEQLVENPEAVDRTLYWEPFTIGTVLKVRRYRDGWQNYYGKTVLEPGDTEYTVKMFREFTPSAFRFESDEQENAFIRFHERNRDIGNPNNPSTSARGQSVESFFTNEDHLLNYQLMMLEVNAALRDGRDQIHPELVVDPHPRQAQALSMKRERIREMVRAEEIYVDPTTPADYDVEQACDHYYF